MAVDCDWRPTESRRSFHDIAAPIAGQFSSESFRSAYFFKSQSSHHFNSGAKSLQNSDLRRGSPWLSYLFETLEYPEDSHQTNKANLSPPTPHYERGPSGEDPSCGNLSSKFTEPPFLEAENFNSNIDFSTTPANDSNRKSRNVDHVQTRRTAINSALGTESNSLPTTLQPLDPAPCSDQSMSITTYPRNVTDSHNASPYSPDFSRSRRHVNVRTQIPTKRKGTRFSSFNSPDQGSQILKKQKSTYSTQTFKQANQNDLSSITIDSSKSIVPQKSSDSLFSLETGQHVHEKYEDKRNDLQKDSRVKSLSAPVSRTTHEPSSDLVSSSLKLSSKIRQHPASYRDTSAASSPRRSAKGGGGSRRRAIGNVNGGKGKVKPRGRGGRGDSPEPPQRSGPLTSDDRFLISTLKARQQELKRIFNIVGTQQVEILDQISARDMNRLVRKARTHKTVPEYEDILDDLTEKKQRIRQLVQSRYEIQQHYEMDRYQKEIKLAEDQYMIWCEHAQKEHIDGAQGDLILLRRAREAANDETRTQSGSEADYFPYYHELPEPDAQIRGYSSTRVNDEKPFKQHLLSYDDQARREVIDEDLINPMAKAIAERNKEWREEVERKQFLNMDALSTEASKELELLQEQIKNQPPIPQDNNAYALSALADVSEWAAQQRPPQPRVRIPTGMTEKFPIEVSTPTTPPGQRGQARKQNKKNKKDQGTTHGLALKPVVTLAPAPTPVPTPRFISQGPGQTIAPAMSKRAMPLPPSPVFPSPTRQNMSQPTHRNYSSQPNQSSPQKFVFQPPQQPVQYQPAPRFEPGSMSAGVHIPISQAGQQPKMPVTFVNQTIASRKANAAASGNGNQGPKGGQRILLPKV